MTLIAFRNSEFLKHTRSKQTRKRICPHRFWRRNHGRTGKKVIVLRDSMLRYHSGNKMNAKFYPSATTKDITDHLRSALREKPDLIHADTYDLMNDVNMMKYVRSITKIIEDVTNNGMGWSCRKPKPMSNWRHCNKLEQHLYTCKSYYGSSIANVEERGRIKFYSKL